MRDGLSLWQQLHRRELSSEFLGRVQLALLQSLPRAVSGPLVANLASPDSLLTGN